MRRPLRLARWLLRDTFHEREPVAGRRTRSAPRAGPCCELPPVPAYRDAPRATAAIHARSLDPARRAASSETAAGTVHEDQMVRRRFGGHAAAAFLREAEVTGDQAGRAIVSRFIND